MIAALESGEQDEWATSTLKLFRSHSPTAVVATIELLRAGAEATDLKECLDNELELGAWITARPDFVEGVRAVVADKDRDPTWDPAELDAGGGRGVRSALARGGPRYSGPRPARGAPPRGGPGRCPVGAPRRLRLTRSHGAGASRA